MDHLSYPLNTHVTRLQIPFLCDGEAEYDGLPFATFPSRKGWSNVTGDFLWLQCADEELAKRVQLWLYFGLLSSYCGRVVPRAILRESENGADSVRLSTACILRILKSRNLKTSNGNAEDLRSLLMEALYLSDLVETKVTSRQRTLPQVSCSVRILLETLNSAQGLQLKTLSSARRYVLGHWWPFEFSTGLIHGWRISAAKAIKYRMVERGWCPAQLADLGSKFSCSTLHFLSGLPSSGQVSHIACDELRCVAYNVDESRYTPQHHDECSGSICPLSEVYSTAVASIIEDDFGTPLVSCFVDLNGTLQSKLIRANPGLEYVAISHVWSGGLGNPSKNGLYECQLRHLMDRIIHLRGKMTSINVKEMATYAKLLLFWMDTFCIPVGDAFRRARKKAINAMPEIYGGASTVLVLDPELQRISVTKMEPEQVLAHYLRSPWMSRCWTLQEASLSISWNVDFKDRVVNMVSTTDRLRKKSKIEFMVRRGSLGSFMKRTLVEELSGSIVDMGEVRYQRRGRYSRPEIWNLKQLESFQAYVFAVTWNNFLGRTTSKPEDLHHIFAQLEDVRVNGIQDLAIQDRMRAILKCHATLPLDLLFCPCRRMGNEDPLNPWMPKFPPIQRLDDELGTMKLFTDCLFIAKDAVLHNLLVHLVPSEGFLSSFEINNQSIGRKWVEMDSTEPSPYVGVESAIACLIIPVVKTHKGEKNRFYGARFLLKKQERNDLHLVFDGTFHVYGFNPTSLGIESQMYPILPNKLVESGPRIFIDCST